MLGGFKGRDTAGAFPLFSLLAATGLGPTAISVWSAFIVQALLAFLGCRAAADLTALGDGPPRDLTPIGRIGVIWLCDFAPVLAWRLAFGHLNLVVGLLPFAAALALVAAAAARTLTLSLGGVSAAAFVLGTGTTIAKSLVSPLKSLYMVITVLLPSRTKITWLVLFFNVPSALLT